MPLALLVYAAGERNRDLLVKIDFEGRTWLWEFTEITIDQAEKIEDEGPWKWSSRNEDGSLEERSGRSLFDWLQAVNDSRPRAYRVLYWLMRAQNDDPLGLDEANCAFPALIIAYVAAVRAEAQAAAEAEAEPDPTQPPATPPTQEEPPPGLLPAEPPPESSPSPSNGS